MRARGRLTEPSDSKKCRKHYKDTFFLSLLFVVFFFLKSIFLK